MGKSYRRGYRNEKALADRWGGERQGLKGRASADVVKKFLAIESKERQVLPKWLEGAMRQAESAVTRGEGELAVVQLHELNRRHDNDLIIMRLSDFEQWFGLTDQLFIETFVKDAMLREARASVALDHDDRVQTQYEEEDGNGEAEDNA